MKFLHFLPMGILKRPVHLSYLNKMGETNYEVEKEMYMNRPDSERRKNGTVDLNSIETWNQYFNKNRESLVARPAINFKQRFHIADYPVIPEYNDVVSIWRGDITTLMIDAIVNAANNRCLGGGGVDGAIHRAAGNMLLQECRTLNGCETGNAKITGGYQLPAKNVIHTVGPIGEKPELLLSCYEKCMQIALQNNIRSIAFPCISTGIYGYPQSSAAVLALTFIRDFVEKHGNQFERIIFCLFLKEDVEIYESLMQLFFPVE